MPIILLHNNKYFCRFHEHSIKSTIRYDLQSFDSYIIMEKYNIHQLTNLKTVTIIIENNSEFQIRFFINNYYKLTT